MSEPDLNELKPSRKGCLLKIVWLIFLIAWPIVVAELFLTTSQRVQYGELFAFYLVFGIPLLMFPKFWRTLWKACLEVKENFKNAKSSNGNEIKKSGLFNPIYWIAAVLIVLIWKWSEIVEFF